jgi:hypothetical protein
MKETNEIGINQNETKQNKTKDYTSKLFRTPMNHQDIGTDQIQMYLEWIQ